MANTKLPMQPIYRTQQGVPRFTPNRIVCDLLERATSLNELRAPDYSEEEWQQFYQLLGYSVFRYHELSLVSDRSAQEASAAAREVDPKFFGCRDKDCPIHKRWDDGTAITEEALATLADEE